MLDRNDSWERYVELVAKLTFYIKQEFYSYTRTLGVKGHPRTKGKWQGKNIKGTMFRWYYTGGTFCVLKDFNGNVFIGMSVCSKKKKSFRKKSGRHAAKKRALETMDLAYEVCGGYDNVAFTTPYKRLPTDRLSEINIRVGSDTVTGIGLSDRR